MSSRRESQVPARLSAGEIRARLAQPSLVEYPFISGESMVGNFPGSIREASVLVPFYQDGGQWQLVFIRRTETVGNHKGQVAFPGGGAEPGDISGEATALREAWEEIGLRPEDVRLLGNLKPFNSHSGFRITPYVGIIPWPYPLKISNDEVSRVFSIPLAWLARPENHYIGEFISLPGREPRKVYYFLPFDGEILWGISAGICITLLTILGLLETHPSSNA